MDLSSFAVSVDPAPYIWTINIAFALCVATLAYLFVRDAGPQTAAGRAVQRWRSAYDRMVRRLTGRRA